jgi:hypothetical protein
VKEKVEKEFLQLFIKDILTTIKEDDEIIIL